MTPGNLSDRHLIRSIRGFAGDSNDNGIDQVARREADLAWFPAYTLLAILLRIFIKMTVDVF